MTIPYTLTAQARITHHSHPQLNCRKTEKHWNQTIAAFTAMDTTILTAILLAYRFQQPHTNPDKPGFNDTNPPGAHSNEGVIKAGNHELIAGNGWPAGAGPAPRTRGSTGIQ